MVSPLLPLKAPSQPSPPPPKTHNYCLLIPPPPPPPPWNWLFWTLGRPRRGLNDRLSAGRSAWLACLVNALVSSTPATRGNALSAMTEGRGRHESINQGDEQSHRIAPRQTRQRWSVGADTPPAPFYFHIYFSIHHYPGYCAALIDAHTLAHSAVNLNDTFHHLSICTSSSSSSARLPVL